MKRLIFLLFCWTSGVALADEAAVRKVLQAKFPEVKIESVVKTPYFGLYEVYVDKQLIYTDENATYLFLGNIIDTKTDENVTEERLRKLSAIAFDSLPLEAAFKKVRGNGKRKFAYFADPNCGYCKRFEQDLGKITDYTVYVFLYPILSPDSAEKSKAVWCSADRAKTWDAWMLNSVAPEGSTSCQTPIDKIRAFGAQHRITGTPTLILADGSMVPGAIPAQQLDKMLDAAQPKTSR
ncbi:MAG TPA: DsbC family protein [Burkholderiales bacterium]|nr:DsbC family protein [Burkholderiales bacterium]